MYHSGQQVVYGIHGVCSIIGTENKIVDKKTVEYLVLAPEDQNGARFYVPCANPAALAKLRPLIDRESLDALLHSEEVRQNCWIQDENQRKLYYRELITAGDRKSLLQMIYSLHLHRNDLKITGRKLHMCDENFLRDAERLLNSEFSKVLNIAPGDVANYISAVFEAE